MARKRASKAQAAPAEGETQPKPTDVLHSKEGGTEASASSLMKNASASPLKNGNYAHDLIAKEDEESDVEMESALQEDRDDEHGRYHLEQSSDEDADDEEEILVVLELADFKNHPILDDYKSIAIEGIDTATPTLHIGDYALYGKLEETVGTQYFYDTTNRTVHDEYKYAGQTTKKIKFTIASPHE